MKHHFVPKFVKSLDIDRAVLFGLLAKGWAVCAAPVTAILIASRFSQEVQGYYFTFTTILALQVFVELGLGTVIIQFASHEWSRLRLDGFGKIDGDSDSLSRLVSIANIALKWYLVGGLIAAAVLAVGGYVFFSTSTNSAPVNWILPWLSLCLVTGITLLLVPVWALLEGCNQVGQLYTFRFVQGAVGTLTTWLAILFGAELWTASITGMSTIVLSIAFLKWRYAGFLASLKAPETMAPKISWRSEMLPMQWRIALSWISGYFIFSFFVPVLFRYHGAVVAGQMGMTWSMVATIGTVSAAWLSPRAPRFGVLVATRQYAELDRQLWSVARLVVAVGICLGLAVWLLVVVLNKVDSDMARHFASRLLPPLPTGLFVLAHLLMLMTTPFSTYLRAHKKEPLMTVSIVYAALVGSSTYLLGREYSAVGAAVGYLASGVICMPMVFVIWQRCRVAWHQQ